MIRIDMTRPDTRHPGKHRRHQGWAICEVAGRRFETRGSAPIYKLATLLWLHGHGGETFEVWDDLSPFGRPGGLAMRGKVRNWARLVNGKPIFDKAAPTEADFSPQDRDLIARAAGQVIGPAEMDSPRPDNGRTARSCPPGGPAYQPEPERPSTAVTGAQAPEAA